MRLIDFFDKGASKVPERPFLIDGASRRTYAETAIASHRIANGLIRLGIKPGTHVAVYCQNSAIAFECLLGIMRAGCVMVSANTANSRDDTVHILDNTDTNVLFYAAQFQNDVQCFVEKCPKLKNIICVDANVNITFDGTSHSSLDDLIDGVPDTCPDVERSRDDVVTLFNSGGTTGNPKGVMMTHLGWEALIANIWSTRYLPDPVHLVAAPMTHAAGGFMITMAPMGATNVILKGFEPEAVMNAIEHHRVTHLFLPPTAIYRMLSHPDVRKYDYSSLRFFTYSGAPMPPQKIKEAISVFGPIMSTGFGQTESGLDITFFSPQDHIEAIENGNESRLLSCGRATPFVRLGIMDDDGLLLPPGEPGEIVVRGNQVMAGYWNNSAETEKAQAFGWHHTGDIGYRDEDGWIFLVDRKRDMIISGGFNVFPSEVEKVILAHPSVQDCAVVGVPDPNWGEAVVAVMEIKAGHAFDSDDLRVFCRERLGGIKTPKAFFVWDHLPRSPVGKVLRRKVRAHFWEGENRQI